MSHPLDTDALYHCSCGEWHYKWQCDDPPCREGRYKALEEANARAEKMIADAVTVTPTWTRDEAISLIRNAEPVVAEVGWHIALAGGVLTRGWSDHDLDLVVYPHKKKGIQRPRMRALRGALHRLGLVQRVSRSKLRKMWQKRGIRDNKWVEVWQTRDNKRIDLLVLS